MGEWLNGGRRIKRKFIVIFLVVWAVQMAAAFYFCVQKQGFHEDEYYTYYSTARTNGFYVEDGQWMDRDTYRNEFVVLPGQGFQYGLVKLVQSWDVHPPVYYWVFHTVASLTPGVFSKWTGLAVNLVCRGINIVLLAYLAYLVSGRSEKTALLAVMFYGLSPAAMSGVVFIRMYEMLTTFVLLCAVLHVRVMGGLRAPVNEGDPGGHFADGGFVIKGADRLPVTGFLLPMAVVTYLGFLTQYYYFIFLFYLAAGFNVWLLWRDRKIHNCLRYGVSQGIAFLLAYLTYPSCLGQMFRGQRGAQATENFLDLSNTMQRFEFFYGLLDEYVFGKMLPLFLLLLLVLAVTVYRQRSMGKARNEKGSGNIVKANDKISYAVIGFAVLGYFLTVSKTALLLGDTSNRYQLPVYGIIVLLLFQAIRMLWQRVSLGTAGISDSRRDRYLWVAAAIICLLVDLAGLMSDRVVFLYPEDKEQIDFAMEREKEGTPVVYLYEPGAEWCIWDVADELLAYSAVYFAAADNVDKIEDDRIQKAASLVVYIADGADQEEQAGRILDSNLALSDSQCVFDEKYCRVYLFQ